jgi:hypothetical protein
MSLNLRSCLFCSVSDASGKVNFSEVKSGKIEKEDLGSDVSGFPFFRFFVCVCLFDITTHWKA